MDNIINWIIANWSVIIIPAAVFLVALIALLWLRRAAYQALEKWLEKIRWPRDRVLVESTRLPSLFWCLFISAGLAVATSSFPPGWKSSLGKGLSTLLIVSLTLSIFSLISSLILFYSPNFKIPRRAMMVIRNLARITLLVIAGLMLLDVWGIPTTPFLLLIGTTILAATLAFRDAFYNLIAGFQINAMAQIKVGDYIKLESGEEGYVVEISWRNVRLRSLDETTIILPNSRVIQSSITNYGRPLKKAKDVFRFSSRAHLTTLTGLKTKNLRQLADMLKTAPDSIVYYHTHHFLEEHHYLTPELSNDFALWVNDALGNQVLAERLASVDTFGFPSLASLRERLVTIIEEYLAQAADHREAMEGREFHFMKSVSVIFPIPYVAHDLREFVEALHKISLGSLYFHIFESRLRLGKGLNDFTIWLKDSLGEEELGDKIARLDPYTYTLEGLRSALIQLIEKRIK